MNETTDIPLKFDIKIKLPIYRYSMIAAALSGFVSGVCVWLLLVH